MQCFILAGGFATRLWPLTEKQAKPLLPIAGKPILTHLIEKIPDDLPITVSTNAAFQGGFKEWFVDKTAKALTELVGLMNDQKMTTSRDANLGTCEACGCPTRAKVWPQLEVIKKHMPAADVAKLHTLCWITK